MTGRQDLLIKFFHYGSEDEKNKADERHKKYLKKKGKLDFGNPNDVWKFSYQRNMTKLAILILIFVFSNHEDFISDKEMSQIKKFYKKKRDILTAEDLKDVHKFSEKKFTEQAFTRYMEENDFHERILDESLQLVRNLVYEEQYADILTKMRRNFKEKV